jgi:hypothetical protein
MTLKPYATSLCSLRPLTDLCGTLKRLFRCLPDEKFPDRAMSDSYIIEVSSQPAGIVVRDACGYRFFAASQRFSRMDGQVFRNAREAERAARRLANGGLQMAS